MHISNSQLKYVLYYWLFRLACCASLFALFYPNIAVGKLLQNNIKISLILDSPLCGSNTGAFSLDIFRNDNRGKLAFVSDAKGNERNYSYDLADRVVQVDDPDAGRIINTYDDTDNLISTTDARGVTTKRQYDEANRLAAEWDEAAPDTTRVELTYDTPNICEQCTNPEGQLVKIKYPLQNMADVIPASSSVIPASSSVIPANAGIQQSQNLAKGLDSRLRGSDGSGSLRGSDDVVFGLDTFGYDQRNRTTYQARQLLGINFALTYTYDNADRLSATCPSRKW